MRRFKVLVTAAVCAAAMTATMTTTAHAADPAGTWMPELKQRYTELISGWYMRADAGYRMQSINSVDAPSANAVTNYSIENAWTLGFGGGYKYKWFRTDVTLDYANKARFFAETAQGPGYFQAQIDAFTVLGNVYLDMGTWGGLTPYVGVGIGATNLRTHEFRIEGQLPSEGVADTTRWNLSWAAMAGVTYHVSPMMLLDVGYRYLNMGEAISGTLTPNTPTPAINTARVVMRDMTAHEFRVGLRWMLD